MKRWQQTTQDELKKYVPDLEGEIERLQEQLAEANDILKKYKTLEMGLRNNKGTLESVCPAWDYLKKWGVK